MAHDRQRHVLAKFSQMLRYSPIVGVFGHRQVGKSTLIAGQVEDYRTLDDVEVLDSASRSPKQFVAHSRNRTLAIDECQLEPKLFPTLKERVRVDQRPGQYVLSGSVRFTSRKAIRESLAGRMAMVELLPLTVAELASVEFQRTVPDLLKHRRFSADSLRLLRSGQALTKLEKALAQFLEQGGLPGVCFIRNAGIKRKALEDLHDLILARDLRLVAELRTPLQTLKRLLAHLARRPFQVYNSSEARRLFGLSNATQRSILDAMESVFLIRRLAIPSRRKWTYLLEDQYEERALGGASILPQRAMESALYRNIRAQFEYSLDEPAVFETYLTRDGARVPLVLRSADATLGVIVIEGEIPTLSESRSGASFLKNYGESKLVYASASRVLAQVLDDRALLCSSAALF